MEKELLQITIELLTESHKQKEYSKYGARDCRCGIYDKWYRYNTIDDGKAYDDGWVEQNKITQNDEVRFLEVSLF
jgi:hypothetical protein